MTHENYDHIAGVNFLRTILPCHVICSQTCKEMIQDPLKNLAAFFISMYIGRDEEVIKKAKAFGDVSYFCKAEEGFVNSKSMSFGDLNIILQETPGHSPGSICVMINDEFIFTGDSLVWGNKIITRLPGGNKTEYQKITKPFLEGLAKNTIVFPGHGEIGMIEEFEIG